MSRLLRIVAAIAVMVSTLSVFATPAAAHETRNLGPYRVVVGWIGEPAFLGQINAVDLRVTDTRINPPKAVEGLEKTITVEVFSGGLTTSFKPALRTRFGLPGQYAADVLPTREGAYKFKLAGTIESLDLNETFESGPGRFGDIESVGGLQYPDKVPVAADLNDRLGATQSVAEQTRIAAFAALALGAVAIVIALRARRA